MLEVKFKKKRLRNNLIFGVLWLVLFFAHLFFGSGKSSFRYFYAILPIIYLGQYFYESKKPYVEIKEDLIIKRSFLKAKTFLISDVNGIKKSFGDFIISTEKQKVTISKDIIDKESYLLLEEKLKEIQRQRGF